MALTVVTRARTRLLTTRAATKRQLGALAQADPSQDQALDDLIRAASDAAETYCGRIFAREEVTETLSGDGSMTLMLARTPIVAMGGVLQDNAPLLDVTIDDAEAGFLRRVERWRDGAIGGWFLGEQRHPGITDRAYGVTYIGGYLLRGDDVVSEALAVAAGDQSFGGVSTFPLLVPGDQVIASGFSNAANNGSKTVVSRTASKIVVTGEAPLVDELASEGVKTLEVRTLPPAIEQATIEAVKTWYLSRGRDREVVAKRVGDLSIQYRDASGPGVYGEALPVASLGLLRPYARVAVA